MPSHLQASPLSGFAVHTASCFLDQALVARGHLSLTSCSPSALSPRLGFRTQTPMPSIIPDSFLTLPPTAHDESPSTSLLNYPCHPSPPLHPQGLDASQAPHPDPPGSQASKWPPSIPPCPPACPLPLSRGKTASSLGSSPICSSSPSTAPAGWPPARGAAGSQCRFIPAFALTPSSS